MDLNNVTQAELNELVSEAHKLFKAELIKSESGKKELPSDGTGNLPGMKKGEEASSSGTPEGKTGSEASASGGSAAGPAAPSSSGSNAPMGAACPTCGKGGDAPPAGPSADPANAKGDTGMTPDAGAPGPGAGNPAADQGMTPEQLMAEYAQLDPQSLEAHMQALKQVVEAKMSQGAGPQAGAGGPPMGAPPAGPPMGAGPGAGAPPPGMMKSASDIKELEDLKKSNKDLETKMGELQSSVATLVEKLTQPMRKSFTGLNNIPKPISNSNPTKAEVKELMRPVVAGGKLTKHEQDSYMGYLMDDSISYDQIKHLIPKKQ